MDSKFWRYTILSIAVIALAIAVYVAVEMSQPKALLLGTKRFDHFTFHNVSTRQVMSVKMDLHDAAGGQWGNCPVGGWDMGPCAPGQTLTWVMNMTDPASGVWAAKCTVQYDDNGPQTIDLPVNAPPTMDFSHVEFWMGPRMDGGPPGPIDMAGQGVTSTGLTVVH